MNLHRLLIFCIFALIPLVRYGCHEVPSSHSALTLRGECAWIKETMNKTVESMPKIRSLFDQLGCTIPNT